MSFKAFMAEVEHDIDFSPVVQHIDRVLQGLKDEEPNLDQPTWGVSQSDYGGREDVIQFFYNALHDAREVVSRGAHDKNLPKTIQPTLRKINRDVDRLKGKSEANAPLEKFKVVPTLSSIGQMIDDIGKSAR